MSKHPTLLHHFRSFYLQNRLDDLEIAIEYFTVFGGTSWNVDTTKPLFELISNKILKNYTYIHTDITKQTHSNKLVHALLSACATGDRRVFSSYKRARLSREEGNEALHALLRSELIELEYSLERPVREEDDNSDKLSFTTPFMTPNKKRPFRLPLFRLTIKRLKRVILVKLKKHLRTENKALAILFLKNSANHF